MKRPAVVMGVAVCAILFGTVLLAEKLVAPPVRAPHAQSIARMRAKAGTRALPRPLEVAATGGSVRLSVSDDEMVLSSTPDANYDPSWVGGSLAVGRTTTQYGVGQARSYLKFGLSAIPPDTVVTRATLNLYLLCDPTVLDKEIGVYGSTDGWSGKTITWNNAPPITGGPYGSISPPLDGFTWYQADVTGLVGAEAGGDRVVTAVLREVSEGGTEDSLARFNERSCVGGSGAFIDVQYTARADAGPDQTVEQASRAGTEVTLDGSRSVAPSQPPAPTTYAGAVAAGASPVSIADLPGSWGFDGSFRYGTGGVLDFMLCSHVNPRCLNYSDWWYSTSSWGETYPGYYLVGWPAGGDRRPWLTDAARQYSGYVDVYQGDHSPPSVIPWRIFVSPDGASAAWVRLPGIASYEWYEGANLLGVGPMIKVTLPLGVHTLTLKVTNTAGRSLTDDVVITVRDTTPPSITPPSDAALEQASRDGAPASLLSPPAVADTCDAAPALTNNAPAVLPLGTTTVTWTARDASGNSTTAAQRVTVRDTTPPTIVPPSDALASQTSRNGTTVSLGTPQVADICDAAPTVTTDAPSVFPLGITKVTWTARDASGNTATAVQTVTVVDTARPTVTLTQLLRSLSTNGKMQLAAKVTGVSDVCDAAPTVSITVTANEPIDPPGSPSQDWYVVAKSGGTWEVWLRGERSGNSQARVYTILAKVTDASGNVKLASCTVTVALPGKKN